jgi:hypothetical protein
MLANFPTATLSILAVLFGSGSAYACDTRHAYNHTKVDWWVSFSNSSTCSIGAQHGRSCWVPPGATADLHYDTFTVSSTKITLSTRINPIKCRIRKTAQGLPPCTWDVTYSYNLAECRLLHNGNTGPVVLNDPANGDVVFYGPVN